MIQYWNIFIDFSRVQLALSLYLHSADCSMHFETFFLLLYYESWDNHFHWGTVIFCQFNTHYLNWTREYNYYFKYNWWRFKISLNGVFQFGQQTICPFSHLLSCRWKNRMNHKHSDISAHTHSYQSLYMYNIVCIHSILHVYRKFNLLRICIYQLYIIHFNIVYHIHSTAFRSCFIHFVLNCLFGCNVAIFVG